MPAARRSRRYCQPWCNVGIHGACDGIVVHRVGMRPSTYLMVIPTLIMTIPTHITPLCAHPPHGRWKVVLEWRMAAGVWQRLTRACLVCSMTRSAPPPRHLLTSPPSLALMPIPMSTNLDSRCLICHESITTIDILSSPFDPASSYCPILIPTLLKTGDMATLSLAWANMMCTMVHIMGHEVTCSAPFFHYPAVNMSGECLVPFVLLCLLQI